MKHSSGARWRALLIVAVLTLSACSERSDPKRRWNGSRRGRPARGGRPGKIEVDGGLVALAPALAGTVASLTVREGDRVQRGQLLLAQASQVSSAAVAVATSELKLADAAAGRRGPPARAEAGRRALCAGGARRPQPSWPMTRSSVCATPSPTWRWPRPGGGRAAAPGTGQGRIAAARAARAGGRRDRGRDGPAGRTPGSGRPGLTLLPARPLIVRAELNSAYVASVRVGMRATVASDMDSAAAAPPCLRPSWCASAPSTATAACRTTPSAVLCAWSSASWNSTARQRRSSAKT